MARPSAPSSSRSTRVRSHLLDRRIDVVDEGRATTGAVLVVLNEWSGDSPTLNGAHTAATTTASPTL